MAECPKCGAITSYGLELAWRLRTVSCSECSLSMQSTKASEPPPEMHPQLATPPAIDRLESFLVGVFLRRYVTYCARRSRYAQMNGALRLLRDLKPVAGGIESDDPSNSRIDSTE